MKFWIQHNTLEACYCFLCIEFFQKKESIIFVKQSMPYSFEYKVKFSSLKQAKDVFDYLCKLVSEQVSYINLNEVIEKVSNGI